MENEIKKQATILKLLFSSNLNEDEVLATCKILREDKIYDLISSESNLTAVANKLKGKRVPLSESQKDVCLLVNNIYQFETCIGSWLEDHKKPFAVEHVLEHYDVGKKMFTDKGTFSGLVDKLSYKDLQTLKNYSSFSDDLKNVYLESLDQNLVYSNSASEVAKGLIGRKIILPEDDLSAMIVESEGFEADEKITKSRYCMLAGPGQFDVMPNRGYSLLNIGSDEIDKPSCVMIRSIMVDGEVIEGPGRVGNVINTNNLVGKYLDQDVELGGLTVGSGFIPGSTKFSVGKYRMQ